MALKGASGAMLVCDITQKETIKNIFSWAAQINRLNGEIPVIILANKCDLTKDCAMTDAELEHFVSELNVPFFKTRAKNGDNVIKIFYKLADMVIDKIFLAADEKTGARVYLNS